MDEKNELERYDRVLANPPFSQNYIKKDLEFPGGFAVWLPEKGKKADLMFVQHMLAVLKANGNMATIMPHGVLFRGGEEREARKYFIEHGCLEAIIGLPAQSILRHRHSGLRFGIEQRRCAPSVSTCSLSMPTANTGEGKAQNHLRPEDIDKIIYALSLQRKDDSRLCTASAKSGNRCRRL